MRNQKISVSRITNEGFAAKRYGLDDNSRGRGLKSSLKNERACARATTRKTRLVERAEGTVVVVPNITIAAKLQRPVLLARERPRIPQNHNTTPYKIQYDAAAGPSSARDGNNLFKPPPPKLINCYTCPSSACYFSGQRNTPWFDASKAVRSFRDRYRDTASAMPLPTYL